MTHDEFAALALSLPGAVESAHFGTRDFRAPRIFATLPAPNRAALNFLPDQQALMGEVYGALFAAIPNKWGTRGWTHLHLKDCPHDVAESALTMAWKNVQPR
ncbi:MmcQ/YjbR family DNA-binding protein [Rhizobium sp. KVB221]|uniref:MmcQ/YjbR family DNA-binding protein n=1 Tax=Rhizobium setariae TaxID=2801340 RepID=A0A936YQN8_9HYPH|nr:MmcQ/YjbR family DNA-binding protein [Rhizobium setariae]MBL0371056.1 MmcQ/YjbR family DNA-binding protein [Rhizobium setariae]